jgi:hypothetical protein
MDEWMNGLMDWWILGAMKQKPGARRSDARSRKTKIKIMSKRDVADCAWPFAKALQPCKVRR